MAPVSGAMSNMTEGLASMNSQKEGPISGKSCSCSCVVSVIARASVFSCLRVLWGGLDIPKIYTNLFS
jgi:hypothetical protein